MLTCRKQGRHRYYRLKNGKIAQSLETLLNIAPPAEIRSFRQSAEDRAVRKARTRYDHLAGSLGVTLADRLVEMGVLKEEETAFTVTEEGEAFLKELGIDVREVEKKRRSFCHKCRIGVKDGITLPRLRLRIARCLHPHRLDRAAPAYTGRCSHARRRKGTLPPISYFH